MAYSTILVAELSITAALTEMGLVEQEATMTDYRNATQFAKQQLIETIELWRQNEYNVHCCKTTLMDRGVAYTVAHTICNGNAFCEDKIRSLIEKMEAIINSLTVAYQTITLRLRFC